MPKKSEQKARKPSRFKELLALQRWARGTRAVFAHGHVIYVSREKGTTQ